jgi:hypothetical protein
MIWLYLFVYLFTKLFHIITIKHNCTSEYNSQYYAIRLYVGYAKYSATEIQMKKKLHFRHADVTELQYTFLKCDVTGKRGNSRTHTFSVSRRYLPVCEPLQEIIIIIIIIIIMTTENLFLILRKH